MGKVPPMGVAFGLGRHEPLVEASICEQGQTKLVY